MSAAQRIALNGLSAARYDGGTASLGTGVLIAGGYDFVLNVVYANVDYCDATHCYQLATGLSVARNGVTGASLGDRAIFAGGTDLANNYYTNVDVCTAAACTPLSVGLASPRQAAAAVALGDSVLIAGGTYYSAATDMVFYSSIEVCDLVHGCGKPPSFTSPSSATFKSGSAASFRFTATGNPQPTFTTSSVLPIGVSLLSDGTLGGVAAFGTGGVYTIDVVAANGQSPDAQQTFTLTVREPGGMVAGLITDEVTGVPVSGITVQIFMGNTLLSPNAITDIYGSYSFSGLSLNVAYKLRFGLSSRVYTLEYYPNELNIAYAESIVLLDPSYGFTASAALTRTNTQAIISGRVTDVNGVSPLDGLPSITVYCYRKIGTTWRAELSASTDAWGFYRILGVPPDAGNVLQWKLRFLDPSGTYLEEWRDGSTIGTYNDDSTTHAQQVSQAVPLGSFNTGPQVCAVDMKLTKRSEAAQIKGSIKLLSDGTTPLAGVTVSLYTTLTGSPPLTRLLYVTSLANGTFSLPAFPGNYLLFFSDVTHGSGYYTTSTSSFTTTNRNLASTVIVPLAPATSFNVLLK